MAFQHGEAALEPSCAASEHPGAEGGNPQPHSLCFQERIVQLKLPPFPALGSVAHVARLHGGAFLDGHIELLLVPFQLDLPAVSRAFNQTPSARLEFRGLKMNPLQRTEASNPRRIPTRNGSE